MGVSENRDGLERLRDSTKLSRLVNIRTPCFLSSYLMSKLITKLGMAGVGGSREREGRDASTLGPAYQMA